MKIFTNGCFDILTAGHVSLLKACRDLAGKDGTVIVGLNSDASVGRLKPGRPINNQYDRMNVLKSISYVDSVMIFDDDTPIDMIRTLSPDYIVKGFDYKAEDVVGRFLVKGVILVNHTGHSTTNIIDKIIKIKDGDYEEVSCESALPPEVVDALPNDEE